MKKTVFLFLVLGLLVGGVWSPVSAKPPVPVSPVLTILTPDTASAGETINVEFNAIGSENFGGQIVNWVVSFPKASVAGMPIVTVGAEKLKYIDNATSYVFLWRESCDLEIQFQMFPFSYIANDSVGTG
jgi:hypothetical protein